MARESILDYFLDNAATRGSEPAALIKERGAFVPVTWAELANRAQKVSQALINFGIKDGDRIALVAQTRLEWVIIDMGIAGAGAVSVPIYASNLADECRYIVENSGARLLFAENAQQAQKFVREGKITPGLQKIVQIDGEVAASALDAVFLTDFASFTADVTIDAPTLLQRRQSLKPHSAYSIIYTSGTTGRPKGVISTHDNMLYEAQAVEDIDLLRQTDVELIILPLAHVFARVLEIAWIAIGHVMAFAENINTVRDDMALSRPTIMAGVPRVFEKFYTAVVAQAHTQSGVTQKLFDRAAKLSELTGERLMAGRDVPWAWQLERLLHKAFIFSKVGQGLKKTMGGRMRFLVSGGAPLSPKVSWFFYDAGLLTLEGFGLTETMGATCVNRPEHNRIGTIGVPLPGTEATLAKDGELLFKGRGVTPGYWDNDQATQEAFEDGWFKTGDIAELEDDGSIRIVDRKKDLIITAGGKNVAPQNIESLLQTHPLISQVVVHGDKRNFLSALITLEPEAVHRFAEEHHLGQGSLAEHSQRSEVFRQVESIVAHFNGQLARYETIKKFRILPHNFSIESGEMTPSLKIKRREVNKRYQDIFDSFYAA